MVESLFVRVSRIMENFNDILEKIESLSLFEIRRLSAAVHKLLDDPARNEAIKGKLKVGMLITYFCSAKNTLVEATINEIRKTRALVVNAHDGQGWNICFSSINLEGIDTSIMPKKYSGGLDRNSLKVGDHVGWHSKLGHDLYGLVENLNPKKAFVRLSHGECWAVPYSLLFLVMDGMGSKGSNACIEGEFICLPSETIT